MVGGVAAIGYGAERPTEDADCVVRRRAVPTPSASCTLVSASADDDAEDRPAGTDRRTTLDMAGMSTWMTDAGPFDVLAGLETPDGHLVPYEDLATRATVLYGNGFTIRAAALEDIIRAKERAEPGQGSGGPP